jgi:hypothetical protein
MFPMRARSPFVQVSLSLVALVGLLAADARSQTVVTRVARLSGLQEVPANASPAQGIGVFTFDTVANTVTYYVTYLGLSGPETGSHIHGFAPAGSSAGVLISLPLGSPKCGTAAIIPTQMAGYVAGQTYVNVHSTVFPGGEIRGQIDEAPAHQNVCLGDGSGGPCPCGNMSAPLEQEGCLNSLGTGGRLRGYGQAHFLNDQLILHVTRSTSSTQLLFQGNTLAAGVPFGDGLLCVGGGVLRISQRTACNGQYFWPDVGGPSISAMGAITTSGVRFYQVWYRNTAAFCTPSGYNLTNGVLIDWRP